MTDDSCRQLLVQCDFFCQFCMGTAVDSCDADTSSHSIFCSGQLWGQLSARYDNSAFLVNVGEYSNGFGAVDTKCMTVGADPKPVIRYILFVCHCN